MRVRLRNTHLRSPFFLFMSHCRWTCVSRAESDSGSDHQGASDGLCLGRPLIASAREWDELHSDVTDLEELSAETAFITEDMLQTISPVTHGNLNHASLPAQGMSTQGMATQSMATQGCRLLFGSNASLRDVLLAHQNNQHCLGNHEHVDNVSNGNLIGTNDNEVFANGRAVPTSNRSSIESNNSNNIFYELEGLQTEQISRQNQEHVLPCFANQNDIVPMVTNGQSTHTYENVPFVSDNQKTIEVRGVTNTCSSDSCIQIHNGNRESDASFPSDASGVAVETESCLTDNSGGASGSSENSHQSAAAVAHTPAELSDILFRFDRQFRGNRGFGFSNWRWPHRVSSQSNGGVAGGGVVGAGGANAASPENTLQKHAKWLRRLQVHQSTATPTNSNSNSLRSNSSGSSSSVSRGGNLQQEWYFYDPRLVPEHRTQRLTVQTDHNRIQTTSYVSNIIAPPTYDELVNMSGIDGQSGAVSGTLNGTSSEAFSRAVYGAPFGAVPGALPDLPENPPPFEYMEVVPHVGVLDSGDLPMEPPPPYVDTELPPVYDLDPSALNDPPPLYDDHSFTDDDLPLDPMDPSPISEGQCQSQDDNFILTQATTITSETDGNFILSSVPNLRSCNRHGVSITPDNQSVTSENDDVIGCDVTSANDATEDCILPDLETHDSENENDACEPRLEGTPRHISLPLEELFRDPILDPICDSDSCSDDPDIDLDAEHTEEVSNRLDLSNDSSSNEQLPGALLRRQNSSIFPGYQLLHNSPELPPWSRPGHMTNPLTNQNDDDDLDIVTHDLDNVTDQLVTDATHDDLGELTCDLEDDLPDEDGDLSRSLAHFPSGDYPAGFVSGSRPPLRWSRGMGVGRWNAQNWAI